MEPPLYLDHAATAPPLEEALTAFSQAAREAFANPSSLHAAGAAAARALEKARKQIKDAFGAGRYRVIWTATGTEGNHLGIQGMARALRGKVRGTPRVLVGAIEHPSSLQAAHALAAEGFEVVEVPVDQQGIVRPAALEPLLDDNTVVVSLQWANNELGSVNPIAALVALTRAKAPHAAFHVDAVQGAGKLDDTFDELGADAIAVAAHKIGGVRGCAAFFLREGAPVPAPLFVGGGHEGGLRSGTENVAGAAAFATAAAVRRARLDEDPMRYDRRRAGLLAALQAAVPEVQPIGSEHVAEQLGSILAFAVPGQKAEPLLHRLEAAGVYASSGSACKAHGGHADSGTLARISLDASLHDSVLRMSLDGSEEPDAFARAAAALAQAVATAPANA